MMETIFGWLLNILTGIFRIMLNIFTNVLSLSLQTIVNYFPFLGTSYGMFQTIGVGLAVLFAVKALFTFATGPANQPKTTPVSTLVHLALAVLGIFFGGHLLTYAVDVASYPYQAFVAAGTSTGLLTGDLGQDVVAGLDNIVTNIISEAATSVIGGAAVTIMLQLIVLLGVGWNMVKLIIEICERYLMVGVLAYSSPLIFSTVASEETSQIFKRWLSMFFGSLVLMTLSVWSFNLVVSGLRTISINGAGHSLIRLILVFAACRIGMRMDSYMQQLGIGVVTTGGGLLDEMVGIAKTASSLMRSAGGSSQGSGNKSAGNVLGGVVDSKGRVRPSAFGAGVLGAGVTGAKWAVDEWKQGGSKADIADAAKEGAKKGFGIGKNADGTRDYSYFTGRNIGEKISQAQNTRNGNIEDARTAWAVGATTKKWGSAVQSADRKHSHLDETAAENGIRLGKGEVLSGPADAAGSFMAANFDKRAANDMLEATAKQGNPIASEQALFNNSNELSYDKNRSEISRAEFDQLGSDMMTASMSEGLQNLDRKAATGKPMTQDEKNVMTAGALMTDAMKGEGDIQMSGFRAGNAGEGRGAIGSLVDGKGNSIGTVTMLDQKAYDSLPAYKRDGFVEMKGSSGATYYTRASGVTSNGDGTYTKNFSGPTAPLNPFGVPKSQAQAQAVGGGAAEVENSAGNVTVTEPVAAQPSTHQYFDTTDAGNPALTSKADDMGIELARVDGKTVVQSDDPYFAGSAVNEGLNSGNMAVQQIAKDTVNSAAMTPDVAEAALFSTKTSGIKAGNDASVATMVGQVFGNGKSIEAAVGSMQIADGQPIIPAEDVQHVSSAMQAAANGAADAEGYRVTNMSSTAGVVSYDFETPSGDGYRIQMAKAETAEANGIAGSEMLAGDDHYTISAVPISSPQSEGAVSNPAAAAVPDNSAIVGGESNSVAEPMASPVQSEAIPNSTAQISAPESPVSAAAQPTVEIPVAQVVPTVAAPAAEVSTPVQDAQTAETPVVTVSTPTAPPAQFVMNGPEQDPSYSESIPSAKFGPSVSKPSGPAGFFANAEEDVNEFLSKEGREMYANGDHPDFGVLGATTSDSGKGKKRKHKKKKHR